MKRFFKSGGFKIFVIITALLLFGSVIAAVTYDNSSPISSAVSVIFGPVQRLSSKISGGAKGLSAKFRSSSYYIKEIESLNAQLADYRKKLEGYEKVRQKAALYENFLEIKEENPDYSFVSASIIGRDADDVLGSFILNKGKNHGVNVNDTVIYSKYLVGVVTSVMPTQCTVFTILNSNVNISAYEVRTRESGFVETAAVDVRNGQCRLSGLKRSTQIAPGGIVCTSGTGGIYPRDLLIGEVKEIKEADENISAYAVIKPFTDIEELIDVFIITSFSE
ncbi:MAG: rod shape-determining protein MreC [Clostridiales bacterium]|nr:rod shape-determining protein MreC [Clostridiales bacterium]